MSSQRKRTTEKRKQGENSQSQGNPVASTSQVATAGSDDMEKLANDMVTFLLISDQKKIPVKKADIAKHVLGGGRARNFFEVFEFARLKLKEIFAIEVVELAEKNKGTYILVSNVQNPENSGLRQKQKEEKALLILILTITFMNGGSVTEKVFNQCLKEWDIDPEEQNHKTFKNVKKLLKEFYRQLYLVKTQVSQEASSSDEISWGPRAHHEFPKAHIISFAAEILGVEPSVFTEQMKIAGTAIP